MYIEQILDLVIKTTLIKTSSLDQKILYSLWSQANSTVSFTEKQANLCVNLLKKYRDKISQITGQDISVFLVNPQFKQSFRTINSKKHIEIVNHPLYTRALKISFPYDDAIVQTFRNSKNTLDYATWDKDDKCWILSLDEKSLLFAESLIEENNFTCEEDLKNLLDQIKNVRNNIESLVPMAVDDHGIVKFVNISQYTPQNTSNDFLESMFFAKDIGILTWDQTIEEKINNLPYDEVVKKFIRHDSGKPFDVNLEETPLSNLKAIVKYLTPCLVIISDKNELEKLQKTMNLFHEIDIRTEEMSVLFRLPSDTNSTFNNFIRENKLNSPLSKNTKVIFIGSQIPKTILGTGVEFNSILNYNYYAAHYKIRDYLYNHKNVINILDRMPQRSFNFALMQSSN